jgi:hypothetical protein
MKEKKICGEKERKRNETTSRKYLFEVHKSCINAHSEPFLPSMTAASSQQARIFIRKRTTRNRRQGKKPGRNDQ